MCPEFPRKFPDYQKTYDELLVAQTKTSIRSAKAALTLDEGSVDISIELLSAKTPATKIDQYVLRQNHDLVIKEAEPRDGDGRDFKAIDLDLLRKCPCALWLCRPIAYSRQLIKVAVAIDPDSAEEAVEDLSIRMLRLSRALTDSCSSEMHIISCWDCEFEFYLRSNAWVKIPDAQIAEADGGTQQEHRRALQRLIKASGISGNHKVHHLRGQAEEPIPSFVENNKVDILVMGTVGRTGLLGFLIGNTAENIVEKISCSLLVRKPPRFVSPVKAY